MGLFVFPFSAVSGLFPLFTRALANENKRDGEKNRAESEGGWLGVRGKRGECQTGLGLSLARSRRSPKRPSESRPSGVHQGKTM